MSVGVPFKCPRCGRVVKTWFHVAVCSERHIRIHGIQAKRKAGEKP